MTRQASSSGGSDLSLSRRFKRSGAAAGRGLDPNSCHPPVVGGRVCGGEVGRAYCRPSRVGRAPPTSWVMPLNSLPVSGSNGPVATGPRVSHCLSLFMSPVRCVRPFQAGTGHAWVWDGNSHTSSAGFGKGSGNGDESHILRWWNGGVSVLDHKLCSAMTTMQEQGPRFIPATSDASVTAPKTHAVCEACLEARCSSLVKAATRSAQMVPVVVPAPGLAWNPARACECRQPALVKHRCSLPPIPAWLIRFQSPIGPAFPGKRRRLHRFFRPRHQLTQQQHGRSGPTLCVQFLQGGPRCR